LTPRSMARRLGSVALVTAALVMGSSAGDAPASEFYGLNTADIDGKDFSFETLRSAKEVVITNVASQ